MVRRSNAWMLLPIISGLFLLTTVPGHTAVGDIVQTTGGGWILPLVVPPPDPPPPNDPPPGPPPEETSVMPLAGNNLKATFGFVASATETETGWDYHSELTYHDHGTGLRLKALTVTGVEVVGSRACFTGLAEVTTSNGVKYPTYNVTVYDNGEPGKGVDTFEIELVGFQLEGETADYHRRGVLGGGNIQTRQ